MMTQTAQAALRRGKRLVSLAGQRTHRHNSDRAIHEKCPVLYSVQLCEQDHPCDTIALYPLQVFPSSRIRGWGTAGHGDGARKVRPHLIRAEIFQLSCTSSRVRITPEGHNALLKLSKGDMRRALNVLQASCNTVSSWAGSHKFALRCRRVTRPMIKWMKKPFITVRELHTPPISKRWCNLWWQTTFPPATTVCTVHSLCCDIFLIALEAILRIKIDRGLALQDLVIGVFDFLQKIMFPLQTRVYLLDQLAAVE